MRIGYLMNTYPVPSATFIRREIAALEGQGVQVTRFAVRRWEDALVDPDDMREQGLCTYLLDAGALRLGIGALREALVNPRGMARGISGAWHLWRKAERGARVGGDGWKPVAERRIELRRQATRRQRHKRVVPTNGKKGVADIVSTDDDTRASRAQLM